ncbi:FMN-binding protein [candidate division KSB1 bacterium]
MAEQKLLRSKNTLFIRLFYFLVFAVLCISFWIGKINSEPDLKPHIKEIIPSSDLITPDNGIYYVYDSQDNLLGWAASGESNGYGGPLIVIAAVDTSGIILNSKIIQQKETPVFFRMVRSSDFLNSLINKNFDSADYDYNDVVGITGATKTSDAIVESIKKAISEVTIKNFGKELPLPRKPFEFGSMEILILLLFAAGISSIYIKHKITEWLRWMCQITSLIFIGFWENSPITFTKISTFLMGYFPDLNTGIYWYILIGGFVITILLFGKSIYCTHVCPFRAAQRCIGIIGGSGFKLPQWAVITLNRSRNFFAFTALTAALIFAQPGLASYEPFGAIFSLNGTFLQWFLLFVVLILSLIIRNPWCFFFCPMRTCERVLIVFRTKILSIINK